MAGDIIYYRATDPASVQRSLDAYQEQVTEFNELVRQFEQDHFDGRFELAVLGNGDVLFASYLKGDWRKDGLYEGHETPIARDLVVSYESDEFPAGWHYYVKDEEVRPYRGGSDADSKAACAAIDDLNSKSPGGLRAWISDAFDVDLYGFGFEPVGDTFYIIRGQTWITRDWDGNEHFERVKVSEYWMDKEAAEEAAEEEV